MVAGMRKREIRSIITQDGVHVNIKVLLDGTVAFEDGSTFVDKKHSDGQFADLFHELTLGRYREPTPKIKEVSRNAHESAPLRHPKRITEER